MCFSIAFQAAECISIHALREESDRANDRKRRDRQDFNPRSP